MVAKNSKDNMNFEEEKLASNFKMAANVCSSYIFFLKNKSEMALLPKHFLVLYSDCLKKIICLYQSVSLFPQYQDHNQDQVLFDMIN